MTSTPDQLRRLADRYTAAWCSQDPASVAACYTTQGSLCVNDGAPALGRDAITATAQGFMTTFPDMKVMMDDLSVDGDQIAYHWTLSGTNSGPGGKGKRVHISGFEEWKIADDGLIAESRGHFDSAEYERQLQHGADSPR